MTIRQQKKYYQNKLPKIIASLSRGYKPQKIILFGSMLSPQKSSNDIDLLLVKKTPLLRLGQRAMEAEKYIPFEDIPIDFLIFTPEEIDRELNRDNVFIAQILNKGKLLYEEKV